LRIPTGYPHTKYVEDFISEGQQALRIDEACRAFCSIIAATSFEIQAIF